MDADGKPQETTMKTSRSSDSETAAGVARSASPEVYAEGDIVRINDGKSYHGRSCPVVYQPEPSIIIVRLPDGLWPFTPSEIERVTPPQSLSQNDLIGAKGVGGGD